MRDLGYKSSLLPLVLIPNGITALSYSPATSEHCSFGFKPRAQSEEMSVCEPKPESCLVS